MLGLLWVSFLIPGARARENYYPDPGTALRAWAPDGVTPLASIGISDNLMGLLLASTIIVLLARLRLRRLVARPLPAWRPLVSRNLPLQVSES